jgi:hypothetical protein
MERCAMAKPLINDVLQSHEKIRGFIRAGRAITDAA